MARDAVFTGQYWWSSWTYKVFFQSFQGFDTHHCASAVIHWSHLTGFKNLLWHLETRTYFKGQVKFPTCLKKIVLFVRKIDCIATVKPQTQGLTVWPKRQVHVPHCQQFVITVLFQKFQQFQTTNQNLSDSCEEHNECVSYDFKDFYLSYVKVQHIQISAVYEIFFPS